MKNLKVKYALLIILPIMLMLGGLTYLLKSEKKVTSENCSREIEVLQSVKNLPGIVDADIDSTSSDGCSLFFMINSNSVSFAHDLKSEPLKINTYLFNEDEFNAHNVKEYEEFSVARKTKRGRNHLLITDNIYFENSISIKEGLGIYIEEVLLN